MTVVLPRSRLVYVPIPKVACTSIKRTLWEIDVDGRTPLPAGGDQLHGLWPAVPDGGRIREIPADFFSFAVVRDPVRRFISGYRNRIIHHEDLVSSLPPRALARGLDPRPPLEEFVDRFWLYYQLSRHVRGHFTPQFRYIFRMVHRLDALFSIEQMPRLAERLSEHLGQPVEFPREQTGGPSIDAPDPEIIATIASLYRMDYEWLARGREVHPSLPEFELPAGSSRPPAWSRLAFPGGRFADRIRTRAARALGNNSPAG